MFKFSKYLVLALLVFLGFVPYASAHEADILDTTTNQPTYKIENDGSGFDIFPIPTGFTCASAKTTFCSAYIDTDIGWNLMRNFVNPNNTDPLVAGTYSIVDELGSPCVSAESFSTCSSRTGNTWETFEISPSANPTGVATTTSISPTSTPAGSGNFTLAVYGSGFLSGTSTVRWAGAVSSTLSTTFISSSSLTGAVLSTMTTSTGTSTIFVYNTPHATGGGGGDSNGQNFTITSSTGPGPGATSSFPYAPNPPVNVGALTIAVAGLGILGTIAIKY